jgi:hypothetical protein
VAVDEIGVVDPAPYAPPHMRIAEFVESYAMQGFQAQMEALIVDRARTTTFASRIRVR